MLMVISSLPRNYCTNCIVTGILNLILMIEVYEFLSQGLLGLCCPIETRDHIERITLTAVLFE